MKKNKHFTERGLTKAIAEIKRRDNRGYNTIIKSMIAQIRLFRKKASPAAKLLVGVSGGIDSAVVAFLAKKAVGSDRVILVYLPAEKNDEGMQYFPILKKFLNVKDISLISVEEVAKGIEKIIQSYTKRKLDPITKGNIASRVRINIMYAIAKEKNALVLGTSNRTEFVQGYATKYGTPMSCDLGILDELYKTDVLEIASKIGVPIEILRRAPTTGFYVGQTHEKELGATLLEQDAAAYLLFEKKMSNNAICLKYGVSKKYLFDFIKKYENSSHKRMLQSAHIILGHIKK
ncbi:MAG: NAD(+) synthase [Candidatus Magasanikbacteria bacterium]|nr:NAD(+) synthase [Candidatus Magasanikbacteria bacterium]